MSAIEIPNEWRITWYVSPLDENPTVKEFCFWDELEDWIQEMENNVDCFDLESCVIERLDT